MILVFLLIPLVENMNIIFRNVFLYQPNMGSKEQASGFQLIVGWTRSALLSIGNLTACHRNLWDLLKL